MNTTIRYIFALALIASFNANANLVTSSDIDAQEMDGLDPIIAYTSLGNSGDTTEITWMNQAIVDIYGSGVFDPIIDITKVEFESEADADGFWMDTSDTDSKGGEIYTGSLINEPAHYLVKIGGGQLTYDTFLYKNIEDLALAEVGLGWLEHLSGFYGNNFDVYRLSHISSAVPVPASIWLFGTALIGFIGFARRTKV